MIGDDSERGWRIGTRIALLVAGALVVVLAATGAWLSRYYQPPASTFSAIGTETSSTSDTIRGVHYAAALLFCATLVALAVGAIGLFVRRRSHGWLTAPVGTLVLVVGALFTGSLLPWDQLALFAVTVGSDGRGYGKILQGDEVRFVLLGSDELSTPTVSRFFWAHTIVIPLLLVGTLVAIAIGARRRARALPVEPHEEFAHQ